MKHQVTRLNLLLISFAAIFGSGWLFAPFYAAQLAGPASLLAWGLGMVISMVIGITMAEVITLFPKAGGINSVAGMTHGKLLALLVTSLNLLVFIVLPAIEVRAVLQYVSSKFPILISSESEFSILGYLLALILFALVTIVNLFGAKLALALNNLMVIFKVVTPVLVCIFFPYAVIHSSGFDPSRFTAPFFSILPVSWEQVFQAISVSGIIFSFNGFNQATLFAGEAKNPQKAVPFAILGSLFFAGVLYLILQYVFLISVPPESYLDGWNALSFDGDRGPFAALAAILGVHWLLAVIYADAVVSPLGTAFNYATAAPRLFYTLTEGYPVLLQWMRQNRHGVPYLAVLISFVLEMIAFVFLPTLKAMISILVAAFVLCYTTAPVSLLTLRKTKPHLTRPFRVRYALLFCYLSILFSNLMTFSCGWIPLRNLGFAITLISGLYLFKAGTRSIKELRGATWFLFQTAGLIFLSYLEKFRETSFEFSMIGIAVLSIVTLFLSQQLWETDRLK